MDESDPSMQIPTIMSSEDSLSGGTSEENAAGNNGRTSMYSRDDGFLVNDTMTSGALWNAPTSPGKHTYFLVGSLSCQTPSLLLTDSECLSFSVLAFTLDA